MKVTCTIYADVPQGFTALCKAAGFPRADIWRRYGALGNVGGSASALRTEIIKQKIYHTLHIDETICAETTKDIVNDILTDKAAAKLHYATEKGAGRTIGNRVLGIDKGYTEALTDSDGDHHGQDFGKVMTQYSDEASDTGKQRNKLHALEKKHRAAGRIAKADRIKSNNLGRQKIDARKVTTQKQLRTIAYQAAHSIVDKAAVVAVDVASDDLTAVIASKHQYKRFNRRMSAWAKGVLAEALDPVYEQRHARHVLVNGAYTSQMTSLRDSTNGLLQGRRAGDKFYRLNKWMGGVLQANQANQANHCAALNVLARLDDSEITRLTPYREVRRILLARSPAQLSVKRVKRVELGARARQPTADKSYAQLCENF